MKLYKNSLLLFKINKIKCKYSPRVKKNLSGILHSRSTMWDKEAYDNEFYVRQEAEKIIGMMQTEGDLVQMMKKHIIDYVNPPEDVSDESDDDTTPSAKVDVIQAQVIKILHKVHISFLLWVMVKICVNGNLFCCSDCKALAAYLQGSAFWSMPKNSSVVMMHLEKNF